MDDFVAPGKREIAGLLKDIGTLLEIKGENEFKVRAYYNGARIIEDLDEDIGELVRKDKLKDIRGIGKALNEKISEYVATGRLQYYDRLTAQIPESIFEFLRIPGLGPKKAREIYYTLGISSVGELEYACMENRLLNHKGFGAKTQERVLKGIQNLNKYKGKLLYSEAYEIAHKVLHAIKNMDGVRECSITGELRRKMEVISGIDILISSEDIGHIRKAVEESGLMSGIEVSSQEMISGVNEYGIMQRIFLSSPDRYFLNLFCTTGCSNHVDSIMERLDGKSMSNISSEEDVYKVCGMDYVAPELREFNGEIDAALCGRLPSLVSDSDIKGVLHIHTSYSDGANTIEEMASAAKAMGYSYMGIGDHSKSSFHAHGLTESDIRNQLYEISRFNDSQNGIRIFKGIECDILADGRLDYDDSMLELFDYVVASVHSKFGMDEKTMTDRIKRALENKYVTVLGHPTGRLLLAREPYNVDVEEIIRHAANCGKAIEINANPHRMDLDWRYLKYGAEAGVKFVINPDAHNSAGIYDAVYGVNMARKGWLQSDNILNALDQSKIWEYFCK